MNMSLNLPQSIEGLWLVWIVSAAICTLLTVKAIRGLRWRHMRDMNADEAGAAYTLSYVMIIPLYMLLMCLMIETPLIMSAKLGTVYSGYASARSASVWSSATEWKEAEKKAKLAGLKAFIPFASGTQPIYAGGVPKPEERRMLFTYAKAYMVANGTEGRVELPYYLGKKASYASKHFKVELKEPESWDSDIVVTTTYEFPFNVPGIGRLLGKKRTFDGRYVYPITTQVTLQNEAPQNDEQTLGIGYGTFKK